MLERMPGAFFCNTEHSLRIFIAIIHLSISSMAFVYSVSAMQSYWTSHRNRKALHPCNCARILWSSFVNIPAHFGGYNLIRPVFTAMRAKPHDVVVLILPFRCNVRLKLIVDNKDK
jgi:hypothetical protein